MTTGDRVAPDAAALARLPDHPRTQEGHGTVTVMNEPATGAALDIAGLAALLNVSTTTAYRLASTREVPGFKVGSRWRFWEHEVRQALAARDPWQRTNQARARRRSGRRAA